jgi:hypothetical protein
MATTKQIESSRRNGALSQGPVSDSGRATSRLNATRHGLASDLTNAETITSSAFIERREKWAPNYQTVGDEAEWALDQLVAASLRIEQCGRSLEVLSGVEKQRATRAWEQDQELEAAAILTRLARNPALASRQLASTPAGVELLIDAWLGLAEAFHLGRDWTAAEASKALDLLGVATDCRLGGTPIDPPAETESIPFRKDLVRGEIERLEALREDVVGPLDDMNHQIAMVGELALLSKPARLILRYEREAWRRYHEAVKTLKTPTSEPAPTARNVPRPVAPKPAKTAVRNEPERDVISDEEIRSGREFARQFLASRPPEMLPTVPDGDDEWFDEMERQMFGPESGSGRPLPGNFVPIAVG